MANGLHINPTLFNKYIKNIEKKIDKKIDEVDNEFEAGMVDIVTMAKQLVPVAPDGGLLKNSIYFVKDKQKLSYTLIANTRYAAYVEFGTGKYAKNYVAGLEEYWKKLARRYYKNGKGKTDKQPFLYPSIIQNLPKIYLRIKNIIKVK